MNNHENNFDRIKGKFACVVVVVVVGIDGLREVRYGDVVWKYLMMRAVVTAG